MAGGPRAALPYAMPPDATTTAARPTPPPAAPARPAAAIARGGAGVLQRAFSVPLLQKLIFADVSINLLAFVAVQVTPQQYATEILILSLVVTVMLNAALVVWALRPLALLEATTSRVSHGDLEARVPATPLADRNIARIAAALNELLDGVTADRQRMRQLAAQVISAGDEERAHIARELHDSTAQALSALEFMLSASLRDAAAAPVHDRMRLMHEIVAEALVEVRTLSHDVHPRVLDDLGLAPAVEYLARRTREATGVGVHVTSDVRVPVPPAVASVVYRVAQEAVRNATRHAGPRDVHLTLAASAREVELTVTDDGAGFDLAGASADRRGMGLFVMRERVALVGGALAIDSQPGRGTRVHAAIPLAEEAR